MMVGLDSGSRASRRSAYSPSSPRGAQRLLDMVNDYQAFNVSDKVLRIILSYTDFVNQRVWRKPASWQQ